MEDRILLIDFGSQFTQLIARKLRRLGAYCEVVDGLNFSNNQDKVKGIILSGAQNSVCDDVPLNSEILERGIPILGICYGMQLIAKSYGADVVKSHKREYGRREIKIQSSEIFKDLPKTFRVLMSHGDSVKDVPDTLRVIAKTEDNVAAIADENNKIFGLQFHPEVDRSEYGEQIIRNFIDLCKIRRNWTPQNFIRQTSIDIKNTIKSDKVLVALSGGVDSSVTAALINRSIGEQARFVFVDHGLLRLNEVDAVTQLIEKDLQIKISCIDAKSRFFSKLKGVRDPEQKRKIIGKEFIEIFTEIARENDIKWLAQGTIYPDVIESAKDSKSQTIKSHHNVGGLPENLEMKLIEPLRTLFKDEVRRLGFKLGLSRKLIYRQPFPGPGLAIRIMGEVNEESVAMLQKADQIFVDELKKSFPKRQIEFKRRSWYNLSSQCFAALLPVKSVGVMGDARSYENIVTLRCVKTRDFMTADWIHLPPGLLDKVSSRIINEVEGVNRVLYDISGKPPATIEYE